MTVASALALGYRGCERKVGEAAIAGKHLVPSGNQYDWLGHGVYFWENDPTRALEWARGRCGHKEPFVVGAVIQLGYCLDLVEVEHLELVREAYKSLRKTFEVAGRLDELPRNELGFRGDQDLLKRNLDCAVINYLHHLRKQEGMRLFDTVRSPFWEGEPLYEGGRIMSRTHVQICVRSTAHIAGYFRPLLPS